MVVQDRIRLTGSLKERAPQGALSHSSGGLRALVVVCLSGRPSPSGLGRGFPPGDAATARTRALVVVCLSGRSSPSGLGRGFPLGDAGTARTRALA